jgi:hypothetical protein
VRSETFSADWDSLLNLQPPYSEPESKLYKYAASTVRFNLLASMAYSLILQMKAVHHSETLENFYQNT